MKANGAPEKIYLLPRQGGDYAPYWKTDSQDGFGIEYVRTDAFIERAEEFIYFALNNGIMGTCNIEDFMKLFKKYMKGA